MASRGVLAKLFDPLVAVIAPRYQAAVGHELAKVGLRYEDLYDPMFDLDVEEALHRIPQEEYDARTARLRRALDLSVKHIDLPADLQAQQTPFLSYVGDALDQVKAERAERVALGAPAPYDRTLP